MTIAKTTVKKSGSAGRSSKSRIVIGQFVFYALAGAVGTLLQYSILYLLVEEFILDPVTASTLGAFAGAAVNYLLSHHWVFNSQRRHRETIAKFLAIGGLGWVMNATIMFLLATGVHYLLAQVAATALVLFWNFLGNRFWTFADEQRVL